MDQWQWWRFTCAYWQFHIKWIAIVLSQLQSCVCPAHPIRMWKDNNSTEYKNTESKVMTVPMLVWLIENYNKRWLSQISGTNAFVYRLNAYMLKFEFLCRINEIILLATIEHEENASRETWIEWTDLKSHVENFQHTCVQNGFASDALREREVMKIQFVCTNSIDSHRA